MDPCAGEAYANGVRSVRRFAARRGARSDLCGIDLLTVELFDVVLGAAILRTMVGRVVGDERTLRAEPERDGARLRDLVLGEPLRDRIGAGLRELLVRLR